MNKEVYDSLLPKEKMAHDMLLELNHHLNRIADALEGIVAFEYERDK